MIEKPESITSGIKNCRDSRLLKGYSPQTATFHTASRQ